MTTTDFRQLALSLPETAEGAHMGHPDFRVRGKIFATLFTPRGQECGMVKLTPEQQRRFFKEHPDVFEPVAGGWGRKGATQVHLAKAGRAAVRSALLSAWLNNAPKALAQEFGPSDSD
jgi:hypothetical protein